jgi:hypothetical protein
MVKLRDRPELMEVFCTTPGARGRSPRRAGERWPLPPRSSNGCPTRARINTWRWTPAWDYAAMADLSEPLLGTIVAVDVIGPSYKEAAHAPRIRTGNMRRLFRVREQLAWRLDAAGSYLRRSSR